MRIDVITLFPDFIAQSAGIGVVGRSQERDLLTVKAWNPRDYATGALAGLDAATLDKVLFTNAAALYKVV